MNNIKITVENNSLLLAALGTLTLLSGIFSSCTPLVSENGENEKPALDFSSELVSSGNDSTPALSVDARVGKILARGTILSPDPCHKISGQAELEGKDITLHITSISKGVICIGVVATFIFNANLTGLEPGTYHFRIKHSFTENSEANTVLEQDIQVL